MASHLLHPTPYARWQPVNALRPAMSAAWWQWVASTDSLTQRLVSAGRPSPFRVQLLRQTVGVPTRDEAQALGLAPRRLAWLREVALCVDDTPWVVARSVAPLEQLQGQHLKRLGERSLGSWLFRQPELVRGPSLLPASGQRLPATCVLLGWPGCGRGVRSFITQAWRYWSRRPFYPRWRMILAWLRARLDARFVFER